MSSTLSQTNIQTDPTKGALRRANGARVAVVPADFLLALHLQLFERFADNSQDVLYRAGYEQGLQDFVRLNQELKAQYGNRSFDLWQMDAKYILNAWWEPHAEAGWGPCSFDLAAMSRGIAVVEMADSPIAAALAGTEFPICHFFAGLFAGAISFYERAERHATEVECRAAGGARCRFIVGPGSNVDSSESLRQQGVAAAEIIRRLT